MMSCHGAERRHDALYLAKSLCLNIYLQFEESYASCSSCFVQDENLGSIAATNS